MKKFFCLAALAASVGIMTSCSEDELMSSSPGIDSNTIAFATNSYKAMTRSGETITSLDKFVVSAVNNDGTSFFSNEKFVYDRSRKEFKSATAHYWPVVGSLNFYAISETGVHSAGDNNSPRYTYHNWGAEKDLVAATVVAGLRQIPYPLTFKHLTSQIYVSAEAENKIEDLTYKLVSVEMTAPSDGTYSFATQTGGVGTWEIDNNSTSEYSYNNALPMTFTNNGQIELSSLYWNILPVTDGNLNFRIEYQILQNGKVVCDYTGDNYKECTIENPELVPGKKYRYNFILSRNTSSEITFVASMTDWEDGTPETFKPSIHVDTNGYEYVDLDLPSGMLWATCNLGANNPEEYGNYYMWAATAALTNVENGVDWTTHPYSVAGSQKEMTKYNDTDNLVTLEPMDDAAHVNMGGDWRMPSKSEVEELCNNTKQTNTTLNGVKGILFTSKKNPDKTMFVPAAGYVTTSNLASETDIVDLWSSTRHTGITNGMIFGATQEAIEIYKNRSAYRLNAVTNYNFSGAVARGFGYNYEGRPVRGVISTEK